MVSRLYLCWQSRAFQTPQSTGDACWVPVPSRQHPRDPVTEGQPARGTGTEPSSDQHRLHHLPDPLPPGDPLPPPHEAGYWVKVRGMPIW